MPKLTQQKLNQLRQLSRELTPADFVKQSSGSPGAYVVYCPQHPERVTHPIKGSYTFDGLDAEIAAYCDRWNNGITRLDAIAQLEEIEAKAKKAAEPKTYNLAALPSDLQGAISSFNGKDYLFLNGVLDKYRPHLIEIAQATTARTGSLQITGKVKINKVLKSLADSAIISEINQWWEKEQIEIAERRIAAKAESDRKKAEAAKNKAERQAKKDADHLAGAVAAIKALGFEPISSDLVSFNLIGYKPEWETMSGHITTQNKTSGVCDFWVCYAGKPWKNDDNEHYQSDWKTPVTGIYFRGQAAIDRENKAEAEAIAQEIETIAKAHGTAREVKSAGEMIYQRVRESVSVDGNDIWWVWYNGNDGDDWRGNNVGGHSRGLVLAATPELTDKVDRLKQLNQINPSIHA